MGDDEFNETGGNSSDDGERSRWSSTSHLVPETDDSERKNIAVAATIILRPPTTSSTMQANENLIIFLFMSITIAIAFSKKFVSNENAYFVQRKNSSLPVEFAAHRYSALPYSIAF